jgi:GNAT superfamily N-acetyltransferase
MGIMIEPLSRNSFSAAIAVVDKVFPRQRWWEKARWGLWLSLRGGVLSKFVLAAVGIRWCRYWVAVGAQGEVYGVTGLYMLRGEHDAWWLGWTCVDPGARKQGVGSRLVDFAIGEARRSGIAILKVYTSEAPELGIAKQLYERRGFELIQRVDANHSGLSHAALFYRLPLS